jgi:integrase
MPHANLTAKFVSTVTCPAGRRKVEFIDTNLEGFFVEVLASGVKTYYQRYFNGRKRQRLFRLGRVGIVPLEDARKRAMQIKAEVSLGNDPKKNSDDLKIIPTLKNFAVSKYLPYVKEHKRSWAYDEVTLRIHIFPDFGDFYLDEITPKIIVNMMTNMRNKGYANGSCNRPVVLMRYLLNLANEWGVPLLEKNSAKSVKLYDEPHRQRFLSTSETRLLFDALRDDENQLAANAIELLLLTGARRNEITHALWDCVDLEKGTLLVPLSKSGKPRTVALNHPARELIKRLPSFGQSDWLFPSPKTGNPCPSLYYPWDRVRKRAGLGDLRLHDLRHSYASNLVNGGVSLYVVQQLLGHSSPQMTQRYAHLERDTLTQASEIAAQAVLRAIGSQA